MTQEAHTPEPWEWRDDQMATPNNPIRQWTISPGVLIANTNNGTPGGDAIDRANARRIVACVNALAGIPIEAIESGVVAELVKAADAIERYLRETPHHNATQAAALRAALAKHGITLAEPKDWATELWADLFAVRGMPSAAKSTREGRLDDEDQAAIALIRERVVLKEGV